MNNIKLIVSEFDGILTTGTSSIDELTNTLFKNIYIPDLEAINKLKALGLNVVFMSSDNAINYTFCRKKQLPFYWVKEDKISVLSSILMRYNVTADETIYVGSKLSDIPCMRMVPRSYCTNNILGFNSFYTDGGGGIFTELYLTILKERTC